MSLNVFEGKIEVIRKGGKRRKQLLQNLKGNELKLQKKYAGNRVEDCGLH
jgi:hypothetical protein